MHPKDINSHIGSYYTRFFQQKQPCNLPIKTGRRLAMSLGYSMDSLAFVPEEHWERFVPCGNPLLHMIPAAGDRILNLGCGAGVDSFALSPTADGQAEIFGLDVVHEILVRAKGLASRQNTGGKNLWWVRGDGGQLPFQEETFQWVVMNGVLNLFPDKSLVLREIHRVLKPSGLLVCNDLCCGSSLPDYFLEELDSWAWCMSGASTEEELNGLFDMTSLEPVRFIREEEKDLLYRVTFICRKTKHGGARSYLPTLPPSLVKRADE